MPVRGTPKFDAVALLGIKEIDFARELSLVGTGAFIDTSTGTTFGKTTCTNWSRDTLNKLQELRESMEYDLAKQVFKQQENSTGVVDERASSQPLAGGIVEFAEAEQA